MPSCNFTGIKHAVEQHIVGAHGVITCGECGTTFDELKACEDNIENEHKLPPDTEPSVKMINCAQFDK